MQQTARLFATGHSQAVRLPLEFRFDIPEVLMGAHALHQTDALLTTDAGFFRSYFDGLTVVTPQA